jgi:nitrogen fixation NifU-like protein
MDFDFEELYQSVILDHSRKPRNFGPLVDATVTVSGDNPTCGDEISLSLKIEPASDPADREHAKVAGVGFTGSGCSICMASASMMTLKVKGKTRAEATALWNDFQSMITGKTEGAALPAALGDLRLLSGVRKFPQRVKCATLAWHALKGALAEGENGGGKPHNFSVDASDPDL